MTASGHTVLDHTGDIGLILWGSDLKELFLEAARAMMQLLVTTKSQPAPNSTRAIQVEGESPDLLLVNWLAELNYFHSTFQEVFTEFKITAISQTSISAILNTAKLDPNHHDVMLEIKAITYHQLNVTQNSEGGWDARIIFDI